MSSITGLKKGKFTSINNSGEIRLGTNINPGQVGEAIVSNGPNQAVSWGTHTGTINALTAGSNISYASGNPTFNGSVADTINATSTTYTGGSGISIVGTTISTSPSLPLSNSAGNIILNYHGGQGGLVVSAGQLVLNPDTTTLGINGVAPHYVEVLKVPNTLTINGSAYDGSAAVTLLTPDTTYFGGNNISIDTTTVPNYINLDTSITDMRGITYESGFFATTLTGNDYPSSETVCTYLDLTSATNLMPAAASPFLATKIQETYLLKYVYTTYYEYSTNFRTSFVAQSANVMVEFRAVIRCDNRVMYGALYDYNAGAYWTTPQTQNRFNYNDETDQDYSVFSWWIDGLTPGTTYYVSPYFRSNTNTSYIYAGNGGTADGFAPGIFRVIDGGSNVSVY